MTLGTLIDFVDKMKKNQFPPEVKTAWVNEIEGQIQTEVLLLSPMDAVQYTWPESRDTVLIVEPPYDKLYRYYLESMILFEQEEMDRYQNSQAMFQKCYNEFVCFVAQVVNPGMGNAERAMYYLSAYALAVRYGYIGTVVEWLESLHGDKGDKGAPYLFEDFTPEQLELITAGIQAGAVSEILPVVTETIVSAANTAATNVGQAITNQVQEAAAAAQSAAETARTYAERAPKVIDNVWHIWNDTARDYVSTGQTAVGRDGAQGIPGPDGSAGVSVSTTGLYQFNVREDGMLVLVYQGDEPPIGARIDEQGRLVLEV